MTADNVGFATVTAGYLAATTGESLLAPVFPQAGPDLGLGTGAAGATFAVLAAAVAVGGLAGGFVLARLGPRVGVLLALTLVAAERMPEAK